MRPKKWFAAHESLFCLPQKGAAPGGPPPAPPVSYATVVHIYLQPNKKTIILNSSQTITTAAHDMLSLTNHLVILIAVIR